MDPGMSQHQRPAAAASVRTNTAALAQTQTVPERLQALDRVLESVVQQQADVATIARRLGKSPVHKARTGRELRELAIKKETAGAAMAAAAPLITGLRSSSELQNSPAELFGPNVDLLELQFPSPVPDREAFLDAVLVAAAFHRGDGVSRGTDTMRNFMQSPDFAKRVELVKSAVAAERDLSKSTEMVGNLTICGKHARAEEENFEHDPAPQHVVRRQRRLDSLETLASELVMIVASSLPPDDLIALKCTCHRFKIIADNMMKSRSFAFKHLMTPVGGTTPLFSNVPLHLDTIDANILKGLNISTIEAKRPLSAFPDQYLDSFILLGSLDQMLSVNRNGDVLIALHPQEPEYRHRNLNLESVTPDDRERIELSLLRCLISPPVKMSDEAKATLAKAAFLAAATRSDPTLMNAIIDFSNAGAIPFDHEANADVALEIAVLSNSSPETVATIARHASPDRLNRCLSFAVIGMRNPSCSVEILNAVMDAENLPVGAVNRLLIFEIQLKEYRDDIDVPLVAALAKRANLPYALERYLSRIQREGALSRALFNL